MVATSVPSVSWTDVGFVAPSGPAILAGVQADINAAFGKTLNYQLTTPQGQLSMSWAALVENVDSLFVYYTNQVDPAYATGRMQDAIARIYFIQRLPAEPTTLQVQCNGALGAVLPEGSTIIDPDGNIYASTTAATIPSAGFVTVPFAAVVPGPTAVPEECSIYQTVSGWDSVVILSGTVGTNTETRSQFEARRQQMVAKNSVSMVNSILGAVLEVDNVLDAYVTENDQSVPAVVGGVQLAANSIFVAVVGGDPDEIAHAIWSKKSPGCAYNGNTAVIVVDDSAGYSPPFPSYTIRYENPAPLPFLFAVVITDGPLVPADAETQIQNAIIAAFNGTDGGARARIGATVYASRFVGAVYALGDWVEIESLLIGSNNNPDSVFQGSIAGTTLTVATIASGVLAPEQTITDDAGDIIVGTTIVSQLSGPTGGLGTYEVSAEQTVGLRVIEGSVADRTSVQVNIDQTPTIAAQNISVELA